MPSVAVPVAVAKIGVAKIGSPCEFYQNYGYKTCVGKITFISCIDGIFYFVHLDNRLNSDL